MDLPVVVITVHVLLQTTAIAVVAGVPPLVDLTLGNSRFGSWIRLRSGIAAIILLGVANNDHTVVNTSSTASILSDDTVLVEPEDIITSIDANIQRVSLQLGLDIINAVSDSAPSRDLSDSFLSIMSAPSFSAG